ncbi:MAG: type II secretion system protein [Patescibacteria group bacterium]|jgi:prepilin-type N-terminal cleavage/methylation domain-containing protein
MSHRTEQNGFTLIEVLIVVGIVAVIATFGSMSLAASRERAQTRSTGDSVVQLVREAQSRSMTAQNGRAWGLRCQLNTIILFSYTSTQPELTPETTVLPQGYSCSIEHGPVQFEKLTGASLSATSIVLEVQGHDLSKVDIAISGQITSVNL